MTHAWGPNQLSPERVSTRTGKIIPATWWFPKCGNCGALVALGKRNTYRATPRSEWSHDEPPCLPHPQEEEPK